MQSLKNFYSGKKILITGNTGFKGSWLTQILTHWGAEVIGYALPPSTSPSLFQTMQLEPKITQYFHDIRDFSLLNSIFSRHQPEIVFHLAAQPIVRRGYDNPLETFSVNTLGTVHVLEAIRLNPSVTAGVLITTDKVYRNKEWPWAYRETDELGGKDPYSSSKGCAEFSIGCYRESFFEKSGQALASTRAGNVVGGGDWSCDRIIPDIIRSIFVKKEGIVLRNPQAVRPWEHVLEPLRGYLMLGKHLFEEGFPFATSWNFAPKVESCIPVEQLVNEAKKILQVDTPVEITPDLAKREDSLLMLDFAKAKRGLHWEPLLSIEETLEWTFDWYRRFYLQHDMDDFTQLQIEAYFEASLADKSKAEQANV